MKKIFALLIIVSMLVFNGMVLANEKEEPVSDADRVVGDDIEIGEGEFKIISYDGEYESVVGDDIEIGDGEAKIISIDLDDQENDEKNNLVWPIAAGAGALLLIAGGIAIGKIKK